MGIAIKPTSDGWRGIIGKDFTKNVYVLVESFLEVMKNKLNLSNGIAVGYDTRKYSRECAEGIARSIAVRGIPAFLSKFPVPTPVIVAYMRENKLSASVVITASHYPSNFNGVKFRLSDGRPPSKTELEDTARLSDGRTYVNYSTVKRAKHEIKLIDFKEWYIQYLLKTYEKSLNCLNRTSSNSNLIIVDVMHGTTGTVLSKILKQFGWKITEIRTNIDHSFGGIRPDPIEPNCRLLLKKVMDLNAALGVAFDGDGDRVCFTDPAYGYIGPREIPPLIVLSALSNSNMLKLEDSVFAIKTLPVTLRVNQLSKENKLTVVEVPVGFGNLYYGCAKKKAMVGLGDDGSAIFSIHQYNKDAIFATLHILALLARGTLCSHLKGLVTRFGPLCYFKNNIAYHRESDAKCIFNEVNNLINKWRYRSIRMNINSIKVHFDNGWVLLRAAGTERFIRVYAEGSDKYDLRRRLKQVYSAVGRCVRVEYNEYTKLN